MYQTLEKAYAKFTGANYAIAVSSGTAALHVSLAALGIGKEDEVIVPDFTMAACAFAVSYTGATPVFVDCDSKMLIDIEKIELAITPRTKAIMPVHIYGRLCDMKQIQQIALKHKLYVIEDACEAQGAVYDSGATVTCYSFFRNKIINAEEGGIVTTNNLQLANRIRDLKNMAFGKEHNYLHNSIGFNYRMPDSQAALALKSLEQYKKNNKKRRELEAKFNQLLPNKYQMPPRQAVWVYDFLAYDRARIKKRLDEDKVAYREFFKPMNLQPMYGGKKLDTNAQYFANHGLYIILNLDWTEWDVRRIVKTICNGI